MRWLWQHFPPTQTLVLRSEDLRAATGATMKRIAEFLQLAPFPHFVPKLTQAKYERAMTPVERQYLAGIFAEEIRELEQLLGWDCSGWLA